MKVITRKSELNVDIDRCLSSYALDGLDGSVAELNASILCNKVKFPLLEYCASRFFESLPVEEHIPFCDRIQLLKTEGGNVILGIILQKSLADRYSESIGKATEYIADADIWYVCDIIGERVFGYALLHEPQKTIPEIRRLAAHTSNWVIRSLGAGSHYAIKKGLDQGNVKVLFEILLSMADTKDKEIRQGVGWAAKTTAKFHPGIIDHYIDEIGDRDRVANWFRKKIEIGLSRNRNAKGDRG